jgi:hypothetical protein
MDSQTLIQPPVTAQAFEVRKTFFGRDITFHAPGLKTYAVPGFEQKNPRAFLPISVTGSGCALDCDHCETKILEPMLPLDPREGLYAMCERLARQGTEAVLISGGSGRDGKVPILKHIEEIRRVRQDLGLKIMVHTGLVDEAMARGLQDAGVDGVALDIIGADETIRDVYHLDCTVADYDLSLRLLSDYGLSIRPHIILGLHFGRFLGEYRALEMIRKYPVHALILVILTPLHGTRMQKTTPPPPHEVAEFFRETRVKMPETKILVGCARPGGDYKYRVDREAVDAGLNGIAYPAEGIVDYAVSLGLRPRFFENSCSCGVD